MRRLQLLTIKESSIHASVMTTVHYTLPIFFHFISCLNSHLTQLIVSKSRLSSSCKSEHYCSFLLLSNFATFQHFQLLNQHYHEIFIVFILYNSTATEMSQVVQFQSSQHLDAKSPDALLLLSLLDMYSSKTFQFCKKGFQI